MDTPNLTSSIIIPNSKGHSSVLVVSHGPCEMSHGPCAWCNSESGSFKFQNFFLLSLFINYGVSSNVHKVISIITQNFPQKSLTLAINEKIFTNANARSKHDLKQSKNK